MFILACYCFVVNLISFKTINFFISIYCIFLVKFEAIILLVLLVANLILTNKFYRFLRKTIEIQKTIKSFKLNILDKIVKYKVEKEFQLDLEFCCLIDFKSIKY